MQPSSERIAQLGAAEIESRLRSDGLALQIGPVALRVHTRIPAIGELISLLYRDCPVPEEPLLAHADLYLRPSSGLRRWTRPQVRCLIDGRPPFEALPLELAYPMLEWSMNWCLASRLHRFFMIHAAVVARDDQAIILPAWSGSGKSTLCAALMQRGWRLLSDEFCLLNLDDGKVHPVPRPIPLKNAAIAAFKAFAPDATMGPTFFQTRKGDIAHLRPTPSAFAQIRNSATPAWVVLPRYQADEVTRLEPVDAGRAMLLMSANSFNFNLLGSPAFDALSRLMKTVSCHRINYSDLNDAVAALDQLQQ